MLTVFDQGNQSPGDGNRSSVEHMDEPVVAGLLVLEADVQPPGLIIGAVRS